MKSKDKDQDIKQPETKEVNSKEKKSKKVESTGSRWAALILFAITIFLSLLALVSGFFNTPPKVEDETDSSTWQFSAD